MGLVRFVIPELKRVLVVIEKTFSQFTRPTAMTTISNIFCKVSTWVLSRMLDFRYGLVLSGLLQGDKCYPDESVYYTAP